MIRSRVPPPNAHHHMGQGPAFRQQFQPQNNPANIRQPVISNPPLPAPVISGAPSQPQAMQLPPIINTRKVLINPNFKGGGVQGATSTYTYHFFSKNIEINKFLRIYRSIDDGYAEKLAVVGKQQGS